MAALGACPGRIAGIDPHERDPFQRALYSTNERIDRTPTRSSWPVAACETESDRGCL